MTDRPRIPGGTMTLAKAEKRIANCRKLIREEGSPEMMEAWSLIEGLHDTMLMHWHRFHKEGASHE